MRFNFKKGFVVECLIMRAGVEIKKASLLRPELTQ